MAPPGAGHDPQAGHHEGHSPDGQTSDERITQLEREVAYLRALQGEQSEHRRMPSPAHPAPCRVGGPATARRGPLRRARAAR